MTNLFLKVNKDFFSLGLNPTEILILAQVMEYGTNTGDCFMSDKAFAELFGVSDKTISRALKTLEDREFIKRETKNIKGGKERHIYVQMNKIEMALTTDNLSVVQSPQGTKCPLTTDNLSGDKGQNDLIKDNRKDNLKDNGEISSAVAEVISYENIPEAKELGTFENPILVDREWMIARRNELAECNGGVFKYFDHKFYKMK